MCCHTNRSQKSTSNMYVASPFSYSSSYFLVTYCDKFYPFITYFYFYHLNFYPFKINVMLLLWTYNLPNYCLFFYSFLALHEMNSIYAFKYIIFILKSKPFLLYGYSMKYIPVFLNTITRHVLKINTTFIWFCINYSEEFQRMSIL